MGSGVELAVAPLVEPLWHTWSPSDYTLGPEVAELISKCSDDKGPFVMDPEQCLLLDDWFAYRVDLTRKTDRLAHFEGVVIAARQDLKTGALKAAALGKIFICEQRLVVWTAHTGTAVAEAYLEIKGLIESNPAMAVELIDFHDSPGKEELEFTNGRRIIFKIRTNDNVQSLAGDTVILDEGYMVKTEHLLALLPILAARPDPQVLWGSSAGLKHSAPLRAVRKRGRAGDARLSYTEWAAKYRPCASEMCIHKPGTEGCAMDDHELWLQANVAVTRGRKTIEILESIRKSFAAKPTDWASQFLVWWDDPEAEDDELPFPTWGDLLDLTADIPGIPTFALDVSPKSTIACITVAGAGLDGLPVVEISGSRGVLDYRSGIGWVIPRLEELDQKWPGFVITVLAGSSAEAMVPAIRNKGIAVDVIPAAEFARACVWVHSQANAKAEPGKRAGQLRHTGQPELSSAVASVRPKASEAKGTFIWTRINPAADITPAVSMTLALWRAQDADYNTEDSVG